MIRISGPEAFGIAGMLFPEKSDFAGWEPNRAKFASLYDFSDGERNLVDQVVVTKFAAPHSFTGEDVVEISCHGSVYIQQQIIALLIANGCRMAAPGEFTHSSTANSTCRRPKPSPTSSRHSRKPPTTPP